MKNFAKAVLNTVLAVFSILLIYIDRAVLFFAFWYNIPSHHELQEFPDLRNAMIKRLLIYLAVLVSIPVVALIIWLIGQLFWLFIELVKLVF